MNRRSTFRTFATTALGGALAVAALPGVAGAQKGAGSVSVPVTGTFTNALGLGTFTGTLDVTRFDTRRGELVAIGTLTGTLTDALGAIIGSVTDFLVTLPVANLSASCEILHLELGPLDLDLLGLRVHLDKVVLDITAQAGAGNLLGNLLCAIAHLLDGGAALTAVADLLNRILKALG